jgi:uncharacterized protein YaaQ
MIVRLFLCAAATSVILAPAAAATHDEYTETLQEKLVFMSEQQLIDEGYRVCAASAGGMPAGNITMMVIEELDVSASAMEIVSAASRHLC